MIFDEKEAWIKPKLTLNDDFCGRNSLSSSKSRNFYEEWREFLWERVWVKCVYVGVVFGREKEREERRESGWGDVCMGTWVLHGDPRDNKEVAMEVNPLPFWCSWAEKGEGKRKELGLVFLSPFYGYVRWFLAQ